MKIRRVAGLPRRSQTAPSLCMAAGVMLGPAMTPPAVAGPQADPAPIVVALDPGHGGTNLGAPGPAAGVYEKHVTLALAERVRALLEAPADPDQAGRRPSFHVVLCRTGDRLVAIRARARCAAESGARLFLSLHANAVPAGVLPGTQHGFEVFVLGPREIEDDAALAALRAPDEADAAWQSHTVRAAGERALALAHTLEDALAHELGAASGRGVKQAGAALDVLRGAGTPAALVEVGFLDDPEEGARLASASGREPIARALAAAVRTFLDPEVANGPSGPGGRSPRSDGRPAAPPSRTHVRGRLQAHADATDRPAPLPPAGAR